jgi:hypothetical protein
MSTSGVVLQPGGNVYEGRVNSLKISTSSDGTSYTPVDSDKVFSTGFTQPTGSTYCDTRKCDEKAYLKFSAPVSARYVRL